MLGGETGFGSQRRYRLGAALQEPGHDFLLEGAGGGLEEALEPEPEVAPDPPWCSMLEVPAEPPPVPPRHAGRGGRGRGGRGGAALGPPLDG